MRFTDLKIEWFEDELAAKLLKWYPFYKRGFVKIGYRDKKKNKWVLPYKYVEEGDSIFYFETRPDDTWIISFPGSGSTMTQELVRLVANDMNFDEAHRRHSVEKFPFYEIESILNDHIAAKDVPDRINMEKYSVEFMDSLPSPRFFKSHLPLELLPTVVNSTCKLIYVARNPIDVVVSWYNFQKSLNQYQGTFEDFCINFINDDILWGPYWEHVKEACAMRHRPHMMFLFYEDLIKDLPGNIKKIAEFFGKNYTDEQIVKLMEHRRDETTDDWKDVFTSEIKEIFSGWIKHNLKDTDLTFPS